MTAINKMRNTYVIAVVLNCSMHLYVAHCV